MQSSYGETEISHGSRRIGRVRLKYVAPLPALAPRLAFSFGFQLFEHEADPPGSQDLKDYVLADLSGDARLGENAPYVASLHWSGRRGQIHSSNWGNESDVQLTCDLDWHRLEAIEKHRQGKQLELWISLWPRLERRGSILETDVRSFRARIPAEDWRPILEKVRGTRIEVLEVPIPTGETERFRSCLKELAEARRQIDLGEYAMAVVRCRKAAEMLAKLTRHGAVEADSVREVLAPFVGDGRAGGYADALRAVKGLGNVELHEAVDHGYLRSEALFATRTLESLAELFGSILTGSDGP